MPIQFRCEHCNQLLSISRRQAGGTTVCPSCLEELSVPNLTGTEADDLVVVGDAGPAESASTRTNRPTENQEDEEDEDWNPSRRRHQENDAIDMTAMVDVTFLLLIFFMVTASFAAQKVLETSPPQEQETADAAGPGSTAGPTMEDLEETSVVIEVDAQDRMTIEGQPVAGIHELREILNQKLLTEQKTEVLIQAQYEARHGTLVSITDTAMDVGMQRVRRLSRKSEP